MKYSIYVWDIEGDKFKLMATFGDEERAKDYRDYIVSNGPGTVQKDLCQIKTFAVGEIPPMAYNWNWTEVK